MAHFFFSMKLLQSAFSEADSVIQLEEVLEQNPLFH